MLPLLENFSRVEKESCSYLRKWNHIVKVQAAWMDIWRCYLCCHIWVSVSITSHPRSKFYWSASQFQSRMPWHGWGMILRKKLMTNIRDGWKEELGTRVREKMRSCSFQILKSEYIGAGTCCNRLQHLVIDYTLLNCM